MNSHPTYPRDPIALKRDVEAVQVPYGEKLPLPAGHQVTIYQVLGGNYTVLTENGMMARIDARDADALGLEIQQSEALKSVDPAKQESVVHAVWEQLKTCYDPEIPVNMVDLGLVYEVKVEPHPDSGWKVSAKITLTAPGCGMGPVLAMDAQSKLAAIPGVKSADVEVVFDPPWDQSMMSEAARLQLGML